MLWDLVEVHVDTRHVCWLAHEQRQLQSSRLLIENVDVDDVAKSSCLRGSNDREVSGGSREDDLATFGLHRKELIGHLAQQSLQLGHWNIVDAQLHVVLGCRVGPCEPSAEGWFDVVPHSCTSDRTEDLSNLPEALRGTAWTICSRRGSLYRAIREAA